MASSSTRHDDERDQAFRRYMVPELEVLYGIAMRLTRDPHDAEDVVQETLLRAYRSIDRFDGRYPRSWLLTILRSANINRARKRTPDLLHDEQRTLGALPAPGADGRDDGVAATALARIPDDTIVDALQRLSEDHRGVVALVDIDGLAYREAAEVLDVPIGTVMSRLHRARNKLRTRLERAGYIDGELPASKTHLVAEHVEHCDRCGIEADVYQEVKRSLERLATPPDREAVERLRSYADQLTTDDAK